ncbi:MAG: hypothetical protein IPK85_23880 [Gemmatimonadetes bacterium]|nr:hypothetical protein [Gemmatimonadota bacterium]
MSKRPRAPRTPPPAPLAQARAPWVNHLWCAAAIILAVGFAWITRDQVNPDGVAYLDLARAVRSGDFASFVQGYWSPLYPLLLAVVGPSVATAHLLNAAVVSAGALVLHRAMAKAGVVATAAAWSAYLIASLVLVRISAVTPDLLLLVCMVGWWVALWRATEPRVGLAGLWAGAGFLAKTSMWPWLIVGTAVLAWRDPAWRDARRLGLYLGPMVLLASLWVEPLSVSAGHPTLGVTGSLNACWFLRECDGQTPDRHMGAHAAYDTVPVSELGTVAVARFGPSPWTYAPWSDPEAWAQGVQSQSSTPLTVARYATIVLTNAWLAVRWTLGYMLVGPLLALLLAARGLSGEARVARDPAVTLGLLAAAGIAQFVAVQAVTRTLAPFAFLLVAAALPRGPSSVPTGHRRLLAALPLVVALLAIARVAQFEIAFSKVEGPRLTEVRGFLDRIGPAFSRRTFLVVGPAITLMPSAEQLGARVVGQVLPRSVASLNALPPDQRQAALVAAGAGQADVAIELDDRGRTRLTVLSR